MRMRKLTTIGYEGASLDDFVGTLVAADVTVLADIRERAQSRRKGFSKTALADRLRRVGIEYVHLRALGDPKPGREAARAGDIAGFKRIYRGVLQSKDALAALERISTLVANEDVCLMCYEREYRLCHRAMVSDRLTALLGVSVKHLEVQEVGSSKGSARRVRNSREGAAASK
jgi:uncharacterized protein (DUF488 family)